MKKIFFVLCFMAGFMVIFSTALDARTNENLYDQYSKKESVKIHVVLPRDATGKGVNVRVLKDKLEDALGSRASINFDVVGKREAADLTVESEIVEYFWSDEDPLDMLMGVGGAAYDAAVLEHYSKIQAQFRVSEKAADSPSWEQKLKASVTDADMAEKDGFSRAAEKMAKVFLKEAFRKKKARHGRR